MSQDEWPAADEARSSYNNLSPASVAQMEAIFFFIFCDDPLIWRCVRA